AMEYNSITFKPDIKMDITIIYPLKSLKFKYLGDLGSNIKLRANYFVSGLIRFSKSGKMIIEATDVDYLKTSTINVNLSESSSLPIPNAPSIIDLIDDDLNLANLQTSKDSAKLFEISNVDVENDTSCASESNITESNNEEDLHDEFEEDSLLIIIIMFCRSG
ncbi:43837_t:CDS:2, partial [Gigaspora margarita]